MKIMSLCSMYKTLIIFVNLPNCTHLVISCNPHINVFKSSMITMGQLVLLNYFTKPGLPFTSKNTYSTFSSALASSPK